MKTANVTELEVDLLLDAIYERYHYDFRHYARSCLVRRVARAQSIVGSSTVTQLLDRVVHDPETFTTVLHCLTIQVSDLFRDPEYYRALRDSVLPHLRTYPSIRIWVAGCGTGEEAYSFAIMLQEEGLLDRALIYATDIDVESLATAGLGAYPDDRVRRFSQNYFQAGGLFSRRLPPRVAPPHPVFGSLSGHGRGLCGNAARLLPQRPHLLRSGTAEPGRQTF